MQNCFLMQKIGLFFILNCFIAVIALDEYALFPYLPNIVNYTENALCKTENKIYETNLKNFSIWAYKMLDASAKNTFSILQGSKTHLGNWEECINVDGPFMTQYCLVALTAKVNYNFSKDPFSLYYGPYESVLEKFRKSDDISKRSRNVVNLGVCLPASCSLDDITNSFNQYLKKVKTSMTHANVTYSVAIERNLCQTRDSARKLDGWDILFCILCLGLTVIVTFSTLYDFYQPTTEEFRRNQNILKIFSARTNFIGLFKSDDCQSDLRILNGLKSIALCVIVFSHRCLLMSLQPIINFDYIENFTSSPLSAANLNSGMFVDTFFTIAGLLLSYSWLSNLDKIKNPLQIIFLRFIRLTPSYAFIVFYGATLYYFSGSGPMWNKFILTESENCRENWWKSLLYVSNYVDTESTCMSVLWYLSCDLHLFIMGVIIMMVLSKNKSHGYMLISFLLIISLAAPFGQILYYGISPVIEYFPEILDQMKKNQTFSLIYIKTHNRAGIYLLGMIGGIIYHTYKDDINFSRVKSYLIACGFLLVKVGCLYSAALFYNRKLQIGKVTSAIYFPIVHALWAVAVIGILISATRAPPNWIKFILSWQIFIPISKLAYGIYLVHFPLQFFTFSNTKTYRHISVSEFLYVYLADLVMTIFFAFILHIGIEAPTKNICKLIFGRRHYQKTVPSDDQN